MGRCGCLAECNCVVSGGDCIAVSGSGLPAAPYLVSVEVDPDAANQLACQVDGLYVPPASVEVDDTPCIDLAGTGFPGDPILATPIICSLGMYYPDAVNLLECTDCGLQVVLYVEEGDCVALSGSGSEADPLRADLMISGEVGNIVQCLADGVFVPTASAGAVDIYSRMDLSSLTSAGGTPDSVYEPFPFDTLMSDVGGISDIANSRFEVPVGGAGWYLIEANIQDFSNANCYEDDLDFNQEIIEIIWVGNSTLATATIDRFVEEPHSVKVMALAYLADGEQVQIRWTILNSAGGAVSPMAWPSTPAADGTYPTYFQIARIGV